MASSSGEMPTPAPALEARSSGRQRSANSKYSGAFEEVTGDALRAYSKSLPRLGVVKKKKTTKLREQEKHKGPVEIVIGGEAVAPGAYSVAVVQRKKPARRKPKVAAPIDVKLSKQEQEQNDIEEALIARASEMKARRREHKDLKTRDLPDGPSGSIEMDTAIRRSAKECTSLLLDWDNPDAQFVGKLCKVYWDGDKVWYYGRIVNFDPLQKKHLVYYLADGTAEWISVHDEIVIIGNSVVIVKNRSAWPALHFWCNKGAREVLSKQRGFKKGCEYVEYFGETKVREIGYVQHSSLHAMTEAQGILPQNPSEKLQVVMEKARLEQEAIDDTIKSLLSLITKAISSMAFTTDLVGVRVRALTHRLAFVRKEREDGRRGRSSSSSAAAAASSSTTSAGDAADAKKAATAATSCPQPARTAEDGSYYYEVVKEGSGNGKKAVKSIKCIGTIAKYCPATDQHLVVFDEDYLMPRWVSVGGEGETLGTTTSKPAGLDYLIGPNASKGGPSTALLRSTTALASQEAYCDMCGCGAEHVEQADREAAAACLLQCVSCARYCHTYCVPGGIQRALENDLGTIKKAGDHINGGYKCVHCLQCAGCGGKASAFDKPLHYWNLRRIDEKAPDEVVPTCGECLWRFKHEKEFCPLCFKLYPPEEAIKDEDEDEEVDGAGAQAQALALPTCEEGGPSSSLPVASSSSTSRSVVIKEEGTGNTTTAATMDTTTSAEGSHADKEGSGDRFPDTQTDSMDVEGQEAEQKGAPSASGSLDAGAVKNDGEGAGARGQVECAPASPSSSRAREKPSAEDEAMVQCNECSRWVHALCEGIDEIQYQAMTRGTHPVWGEEYLCPSCRVVSGLRVVQELDAIDVTGIFQFPVSEATAPTYYDVVKSPMDLETMEKKAMAGLYKSLQSLRQDFELMCLNAMVFNKVGDEYWRESRTFHESGVALFKNMQRTTTMSTFGAEIAMMTNKLDSEAAAEIVAGETAKKEQAYRERKEQEAAIRAKYDAYYYNNVKKTRQGLVLENELKEIEALNKQDEALSAPEGSGSASDLPPASDGDKEDTSGGAEGKNQKEKDKQQYFDLSLQQKQPDELALKQPGHTSEVFLPTTLVTPPEPASYLKVHAKVLSADQAFYSSCLDECLICGSSGTQDLMLFCIDCGECLHSFCVDAPFASMSPEARLQWRCTNCKVCEICGTASDLDESTLVYCEECDRACHGTCMTPGLSNEEAARLDSWVCSSCVKCENCVEKGKKGVGKGNGSSGNSSGSGGVGAWGMCKETCRKCHSEVMEKKKRAFFDNRLQTVQEGQKGNKIDEEIIRMTVSCNVCENECTASFLQCTRCAKFSHPECNGDLLLLLYGGEAAYNTDRQRELRQNFVCVKCTAVVKDDESQSSHYFLAEQVARINANRVAAVASARAQTLRDKSAASEALYEKHRPLLKAVIQWACQRVAWMADQQMPAINRALFQTPMLGEPLTTPHWSTFIFRARRFLVLWRHKGLSDSSTQQLRRRFMYKGLGPTGEELEPASLCRIAGMAAAFIAITQRELDAVFYNNREKMAAIVQSKADAGRGVAAAPNQVTTGDPATGSPFIPIPNTYPAHEEMHPIISDLMMNHLYSGVARETIRGKKADKDKDLPAVLAKLPSNNNKFRVKPMSVPVPTGNDGDNETGIGFQERSIFLLLVQMVDALLVPCMTASSSQAVDATVLSKRKRESQAVLPEVSAAIAEARASKASKQSHDDPSSPFKKMKRESTELLPCHPSTALLGRHVPSRSKLRVEDVITPDAYQQYLAIKTGSVQIATENNRKILQYTSSALQGSMRSGRTDVLPYLYQKPPRKFRDPVPPLTTRQATELSSLGLLYALTEPNDESVSVPSQATSSTPYRYVSLCPTAGNNSLAVKARKHYPRLRTPEEEAAELNNKGGVIKASFGRDMLQKLKHVESAFLEAAGEYEQTQQESHSKAMKEHKEALERTHAAEKAAFLKRMNPEGEAVAGGVEEGGGVDEPLANNLSGHNGSGAGDGTGDGIDRGNHASAGYIIAGASASPSAIVNGGAAASNGNGASAPGSGTEAASRMGQAPGTIKHEDKTAAKLGHAHPGWKLSGESLPGEELGLGHRKRKEKLIFDAIITKSAREKQTYSVAVKRKAGPAGHLKEVQVDAVVSIFNNAAAAVGLLPPAGVTLTPTTKYISPECDKVALSELLAKAGGGGTSTAERSEPVLSVTGLAWAVHKPTAIANIATTDGDLGPTLGVGSDDKGNNAVNASFSPPTATNLASTGLTGGLGPPLGGAMDVDHTDKLPLPPTMSRQDTRGGIHRDEEAPLQQRPVVKPAQGWGDSSGLTPSMPNIPWERPFQCLFCRQIHEDEITGRLVPLGKRVGGSLNSEYGDYDYVQMYGHINCLRWSAEVEERNGVLLGVTTAKGRAKQVRCFYCGRNGATMGCTLKHCKRSFHVSCALQCNCLMMEATLAKGNDPLAGTTDNAEKSGSIAISSSPAESVHQVQQLHTLMTCPEHVDEVDTTRLNRQWVPRDPNRAIFVPHDKTGETEVMAIEMARPITAVDPNIELAEILCRVRGNERDHSGPTVRTGACIIYNIGTPRIDTQYFHTKDYIFPHHFRSSRLFWSMKYPMQRTTYMFEILMESDFTASNIDIHDYISLYAADEEDEDDVETLERKEDSGAERMDVPMAQEDPPKPLPSVGTPTRQSDEAGTRRTRGSGHSSAPYIGSGTPTSSPSPPKYEGSPSPSRAVHMQDSSEWPVFRVSALDAPDKVFVTRSLEKAYQRIIKAVQRVNAPYMTQKGNFHLFAPRKTRDTYGLNGYHFFGLGLPSVKRAIELTPESVASMISSPPNPQYRPSYRLPSEDDAFRVQQQQMSVKVPLRPSVNGCARADSIEHVAKKLSGTKVTKIRSIAGKKDASGKGDAGHLNPPGQQVDTSGVGAASQLSSSPGSSTAAAAAAAAAVPKLDPRLRDPDDDREYSSLDQSTDKQDETTRAIERNRSNYSLLSTLYRQDPTKRLEVRKSHIHNWGLFTRTHFQKNEMIVEYIGERIRQCLADQREINYEKEGVGSCYLFRLEKDVIVDATRTGGMARFMNHCCEPNAYAKVINTDNSDRSDTKHIIIFAARDIQRGEEITYDYKFPIEEKKISCYCGASRCRGSMN